MNKSYSKTIMNSRLNYINNLSADKDKLRTFLEYNYHFQKMLIEKFGKNPNWEQIPIEEKCYHGWLRPYAIISETIINGRWNYWLDIKATQVVKDKPIPQLHFLKPYDKEFRFVSDMINNCLNITGEYKDDRIFYDFIDWLLYGWGSPMVTKLPESITPKMQEHWYKKFEVDLFFLYPADYFVVIASERYSNKFFNANNFYPTPDNVVKAMVDMIYDENEREKNKYANVIEPCCGSGIILLYQSNHSLLLYAQDIDPTMVKLATLNGYFYIPWMVEMDDETKQLFIEEGKKYYNK